MNREYFNELIGNMEDIKSSDIASLELLRKEYPFYQNIHLLLAKAYKHSTSELLKPSLNKAAIYSVDRPYLKKILDGNYQFIEVIQSKPNDVAPTAPAIIPQPKTDSIPEVSSNPSQNTDSLKAVEPETEVQKPVSKRDETAKPGQDKLAPKAKKDKDLYNELDKNLKQYNDRKKIMQELLADKSEVATDHTPSKKSANSAVSQVQLIEKFIKNEPRIGKKSLLESESNTDLEDLAKKRLQQSDKFLTETLAELLVNQKKYSKAIKIYEKLMVKFPKKTTYFAAQIDKINQSNV